jgi:hypothetical protein
MVVYENLDLVDNEQMEIGKKFNSVSDIFR